MTDPYNFGEADDVDLIEAVRRGQAAEREMEERAGYLRAAAVLTADDSDLDEAERLFEAADRRAAEWKYGALPAMSKWRFELTRARMRRYGTTLQVEFLSQSFKRREERKALRKAIEEALDFMEMALAGSDFKNPHCTEVGVQEFHALREAWIQMVRTQA